MNPLAHNEPKSGPGVGEERGMAGVNRALWRSPDVLAEFVGRVGWTDDGERLLVARLRSELGSVAVLDLGVGTGRTVSKLAPLAASYVGLDYTSEMIDCARRDYPGVHFEHGDARDLSRFPERSFDLVFFSNNGIDCVVHSDRSVIFREVRRALSPRGCFAFSTHNLEAKAVGLPPWHPLTWPRHPVNILRRARHVRASFRSYREGQQLVERGDGWAVLPDPAHEFRTILHYTSSVEVDRELRSAGFETVVLTDRSGRGVDVGADARHSSSFHVLARAPS